MPAMDGCQVSGEIRACEGADHLTPIVALTAGARVEDRKRRACMSKPATSAAIRAGFARWVGETGRGIQY